MLTPFGARRKQLTMIAQIAICDAGRAPSPKVLNNNELVHRRIGPLFQYSIMLLQALA
jgi:hypothetical protein